MSMGKTLAFTGPRPNSLYGYDDKQAYTNLKLSLLNDLAVFYDNGYRNFISGAAQGFDQVAFWAADMLKAVHPDVRNIIYMPFIGFGSNWRGEGLFSLEVLRLMMSLADEVVYVNKTVTQASDKKVVVKALFDRNEAMVNSCDTLTGIVRDYSFTVTGAKGGTAGCLRYCLDNTDKNIFLKSPDDFRTEFYKGGY